jgi:hypothetical protein
MNMMRFLTMGVLGTGCLLLVVAPSSAQYLKGDPRRGEIQFKPFSVSFNTVSGFDSSGGTRIFTKGQKGDQGDETSSSLYAGFNATGAMNLEWPDSFLGSRISTGYTYYFNRDNEDGEQEYETTINIDSTFFHLFSPRWSMTLNHNLVLDNEQQIGTDSSLPNNAQQYNREGDYYISSFSLNNGFLLAPRLTYNVGLSYAMTRYDNDFSANESDLDVYGFNMGPSYQFDSRTTVGLTYSFTVNQHPGPTKIYADSPPAPPRTVVERVNRNSTANNFSFNVTRRFTTRLVVSASVGVQLTEFEDRNVVSSSVNPTFSGSMTYVLDSKSSISASYVHSISQSDLEDFTATIQDVASIGYTRQINRKTRLTITGSYSLSQYDQKFNATTAASFEQSGNDEALGGSLVVSYEVNKFVGLDVGYSYFTYGSSVGNPGYDEDRLTFNIRCGF